MPQACGLTCALPWGLPGTGARPPIALTGPRGFPSASWQVPRCSVGFVPTSSIQGGTTRMKQLSGLDASFLYMETPEMPMHVGAMHVFEMPADYKGRFIDDMRRHMAARLPLAPALRRKLAWMPFNLANPVWIDAEIDLDEHIVPIKLKKGSGMAELEAKVGELHPHLLDRDKPLWKFYLFDGLAPGPNKEKRFGMYTQLHHAAVDGQAAVALASAILDIGPEPREIKPKDKPRKLNIGMAEMLSEIGRASW